MSRDINWTHDEAEVALYHGRAIEIAYAEGCDECWVIAGAQIYEMFIDSVEEIHVTTVHTSGTGDVKFPDWNRSEWSETVVEKLDADDDNAIKESEESQNSKGSPLGRSLLTRRSFGGGRKAK